VKTQVSASFRKLAPILFVLLLAGCVGGKGCKSDPPPPTVTIPAPPTPKVTPSATATATATSTPLPPTIAPETITPTATATETQTPTATIVAATATPALLGHHLVVKGDSLHAIGLTCYAGKYFETSAAIWEPICRANADIVENCRLIFVGQVLRIPVNEGD
jgi:nucleoid-associated protein YgaU